MPVVNNARKSMLRLPMLSMSAAFYGLIIAASGCDSSTDPKAVPTGAEAAQSSHDHDHDHAETAPETYPEAVKELAEQQGMIKKAFESNSPDYAHDPLHKVGGLLTSIKEMAEKDASFSEEEKQAIVLAFEDLMTAFGELDEYFHDGEKIAYSSVSERIESAMKTLQECIK